MLHLRGAIPRHHTRPTSPAEESEDVQFFVGESRRSSRDEAFPYPVWCSPADLPLTAELVAAASGAEFLSRVAAVVFTAQQVL